MAKIYDLEKKKQKAKEDDKGVPPLISLKGKGGSRITPRLEMGPDGEWRIMQHDLLKSILETDLSELGKEEEPKED